MFHNFTASGKTIGVIIGLLEKINTLVHECQVLILEPTHLIAEEVI